MADIAVVFLVDARGHVLLQHRDEHAPRAANQWGMVGGHVEPGEDFDMAVRRELLEETGVVTEPGVLRLWRSADFTYSDGHHNHYEVYAGRVDLTDDDIVRRRGAGDRVRRPGGDARPRPGRVDRAVPAALPRPPTTTDELTEETDR